MATKRKWWVTVVATVLMGAMALQTMPALAQAYEIYDFEEELPRPTGFEKALTKLGRGLSNVMLGWAEIPVTWDAKLKEGKPLAYLLGVAPVLGTARAVMRTGSGVFEVVTFPFSDRSVNYEPILEPEYIF